MSNVSARFVGRDGYPGVISMNYLDEKTDCLIIDLRFVDPVVWVCQMIKR